MVPHLALVSLRHNFQCDGHFDTIQENLIDAINEMKEFGSRVIYACTGPDVDANDYATYH